MQEGDRNPATDTAASAGMARSAAIDKAFEGFDESFFEDGPSPSAAEGDIPEPQANPDAAEPEPVAPSNESDSRPDEGQQADQQEQVSPVDAPAVWPKDRREWFANLSDGDKKTVLDMEKQHNARFTKNTQENADHRRRSEAISEVLKPYENDLQAAGLDQAGAVRFMAQEREAFNRDPQGFLLGYLQRANVSPQAFIQSFAERSGVPRDQLPGGKPPAQQEQDQPDEWVDPMVIELRSELQAERAEREKLQSQLGSFFQQHQQRETLTLQEEIQSFQSAADDSGNPARPHFEAVRPIMQRVMETDPDVAAIPDWKVQDKLTAAYDKAIWLVPEIREQLIAAQVNQGLSTQIGQATVDKAKAAAPRRASPGANGTAAPGKMGREDAINSAMKQFGLA